MATRHELPPHAKKLRLFSRTMWVVAALVLVAGVSRVIASANFSTGPDASVSGARALGAIPEEHNCTACHYTTFGVNENTPGGAVELLDLPDLYEANMTYNFRVRLHSDSTLAFPSRKWGFQVTAVREDDGTGVGTFVLPPGDSMQIIQGFGDYASRSYAEHAWIGTRTGLGGPVEWQLSWQAPATPAGKVLFFAAGNAANGSFEPSGDFIFTTSDSMGDATTPVVTTTWGALKTRYR